MEVGGWVYWVVLGLGAWCVVSFAFALLIARFIRAGKRGAPEDQQLRRRSTSGIIPHIERDSRQWQELEEEFDPELLEKEDDSFNENLPEARKRASGED